MKPEDRQALRAFYQTIAKQGTTTQQQDFYMQVLMGNADSRKKWMAANTPTPALALIIANMDNPSQVDIAEIVAGIVAPVIVPQVSKAVNSVWAWKIWPWNW
jgi:hypothetical protein